MVYKPEALAVRGLERIAPSETFHRNARSCSVTCAWHHQRARRKYLIKSALIPLSGNSHAGVAGWRQSCLTYQLLLLVLSHIMREHAPNQNYF